MNEQDKEYKRFLAACFAMNGLIRHFDFDQFKQDPARVASWSYLMADAMLEAEEPEETVGLPAIKKKRTAK